RTLAIFWPDFKLLTDDARTSWIYALYVVYFQQSDPVFAPAALNSAVASFTKAVEHELKSRIFLDFRKSMRSDTKLMPILHGATKADPITKFIVRSYPKIMLGEMCGAIKDCMKPTSHPILSELRTWIMQRCPSLLSGGPVLVALSALPSIS